MTDLVSAAKTLKALGEDGEEAQTPLLCLPLFLAFRQLVCLFQDAVSPYELQSHNR